MSTSYQPLVQRTEPHLTLPPHARILVVKLAGLGDVLLTMPALRALRAAYPAARIDLLVDTASVPLVRDSPYVTHLLALPKTRYDTFACLLVAPWRISPLCQLARELRAAHYDAVLLCHHLTLPFGRLKYRLLLAATRPALRLGLDNGHSALLDVCVPDQGFGALHEAEYALALVRAIAPHPLTAAPAPTLADLGWASSPARTSMACHQLDQPLRVAIHPGSGNYSNARRWPLANFVALARALHERYAAHITVVGSPDERELAARLRTMLGCPDWLSALPEHQSIRALAEVLRACDLFIGNDSFPMHLAAAAGTPVVAIFGLSNHRAWRPLPPDANTPALVVRRDLPCSPCFYVGHSLGTPSGCPTRDCLTHLPVEAVLRQVRRALSSRVRTAPAR